MTRDQAAENLGLNRTYLDMLCRGAWRSRLALALAIEKMTGGAIPAAAWVNIAEMKD